MMVYTTENLFLKVKIVFIYPLWMMANLSTIKILIFIIISKQFSRYPSGYLWESFWTQFTPKIKMIPWSEQQTDCSDIWSSSRALPINAVFLSLHLHYWRMVPTELTFPTICWLHKIVRCGVTLLIITQ